MLQQQPIFEELPLNQFATVQNEEVLFEVMGLNISAPAIAQSSEKSTLYQSYTKSRSCLLDLESRIVHESNRSMDLAADGI